MGSSKARNTSCSTIMWNRLIYCAHISRKDRILTAESVSCILLLVSDNFWDTIQRLSVMVAVLPAY